MATEVEFTRMSSKGQIVIPKKLREGFEEGTPFAVVRDKDTILLKQIKLPGIKEFEALVEKSVKIAKERGVKETDVDRIIHKHRGITI
ncbi:MAG: AbrB/MazE/SpoVT family DNA-binding domain-containing protein [Candidatus Methanoperedens sp.]|nr:AbrB/MazE/SpoVT family DNA-binding domain-containing protein [Candidatus Methanoperedens sp.]MCZ7405323.1 AbrB/MazE/SpoVT family DNA-binding domain-containing protein [Candidatus Methanoperedens sp.]